MFWTPDDETETITFEVNFTDILDFTKPKVYPLRKSRYILFFIFGITGTCRGPWVCRFWSITKWRDDWS